MIYRVLQQVDLSQLLRNSLRNFTAQVCLKHGQPCSLLHLVGDFFVSFHRPGYKFQHMFSSGEGSGRVSHHRFDDCSIQGCPTLRRVHNSKALPTFQSQAGRLCVREREGQPISGGTQNSECARAFCTSREVEGDAG